MYWYQNLCYKKVYAASYLVQLGEQGEDEYDSDNREKMNYSHLIYLNDLMVNILQLL